MSAAGLALSQLPKITLQNRALGAESHGSQVQLPRTNPGPADKQASVNGQRRYTLAKNAYLPSSWILDHAREMQDHSFPCSIGVKDWPQM